MSFTNARQRVRWLLYGAWAISALFSLPQFYLYEVTEIQGRMQCWLEFDEQWHWQIYMTIVAVLLFFIPVTIISVCYGSIIKKIWMRGMRKRNNSNSDVFNSFNRESSQGIIPRAKVKILKMTFLIVVGEYLEENQKSTTELSFGLFMKMTKMILGSLQRFMKLNKSLRLFL